MLTRKEIRKSLGQICTDIFDIEEKLPYCGICAGSEDKPNSLTILRKELFKIRGTVINVSNDCKHITQDEINEIIKNKKGY